MSTLKKKSVVWQFFKLVGTDGKFVKCNLCKKEYKHCGNTTNLSDHIKRRHPECLRSKNSPQSTTSSPNDSNNLTEVESSSTLAPVNQLPNTSQKTVKSYFQRSTLYDKNSKEKQELDKLYALMIARDYMPFRTSEHEGFKAFTNALNNKYELPDRTAVKQNLIPKLFAELHEKLITMLTGVKYCSITTDMWTSIGSEGVIAVTCHFVHSGKMKSALLKVAKVDGRHTSEAISEAINEILFEFNLREKVVAMVTDNAANMIRAAELSKIRHLPCFAHSINLVVQDSMRVPTFMTLLCKAKAIVTFFKSSTLASDNLRKIQKESNKPELKLIQEVETRWNSSYFMLKRLVEIRGELAIALGQSPKAPAPLTAEEFQSIAEIIELFECFETATNTISGEKFVTSSLIIPLTRGICAKLISLETQTNTAEGKAVLTSLNYSVSKRLKPYHQRTPLVLSTLLDPRFKKCGFRTQQEADFAMQTLQREYSSFLALNLVPPEIVENVDLPSTSAASVQRSKIDELLFLNTPATQNIRVATPTSDAIIDARQYLEKPNIEKHQCPVNFWERSENAIREVALKYMSIPATSVPCERIFSKAGQVLTQKRNRLKVKHLNELLFLKHNFELE